MVGSRRDRKLPEIPSMWELNKDPSALTIRAVRAVCALTLPRERKGIGSDAEEEARVLDLGAKRVWCALASLEPVSPHKERLRALLDLEKAVHKAIRTAKKIKKDFHGIDLVIHALDRAFAALQLSGFETRIRGRSKTNALFWHRLVEDLRSSSGSTAGAFTDRDLANLIVSSQSDWRIPPCPTVAAGITEKDFDPDVGPGGGIVLAANKVRVTRQRRDPRRRPRR